MKRKLTIAAAIIHQPEILFLDEPWRGSNILDTELRENEENQMSRRKFNREFKMTAVKLIIDDELPVKHVAEQLQVHANSLYRWVQEYEKYGESAFVGNGTTIYDYQREIFRLERRNQELQEEVELLKKFKVFLRNTKA